MPTWKKAKLLRSSRTRPDETGGVGPCGTVLPLSQSRNKEETPCGVKGLVSMKAAVRMS